jgi:hypothetical protein
VVDEYWAPIGALASVAALALLVGQEIRTRRSRHNPKLEAQPLPLALARRARLRNVGHVAATSVLVLPQGCKRIGSNAPGWRFPRVEPGTAVDLEDISGDDEDSWFALIYDHPHRRGYSIHTWVPLYVDGKLARVQFDQAAQHPLRIWWRGRRWTATPGPSGVLSTTRRSTPRALLRTMGRIDQRQARATRRGHKWRARARQRSATDD